MPRSVLTTPAVPARTLVVTQAGSSRESVGCNPLEFEPKRKSPSTSNFLIFTTHLTSLRFCETTAFLRDSKATKTLTQARPSVKSSTTELLVGSLEYCSELASRLRPLWNGDRSIRPGSAPTYTLSIPADFARTYYHYLLLYTALRRMAVSEAACL